MHFCSYVFYIVRLNKACQNFVYCDWDFNLNVIFMFLLVTYHRLFYTPICVQGNIIFNRNTQVRE